MPVRLTVLGSGTLLPDPLRQSPAHWVEAGDARVLLDCGSGALHALGRHGLEWRRLSHLVISHFHTDHVGDVAALLWALHHGPGILDGDSRSEPLTVLGPPGTRRFLEALAGAHGKWILEPGFPVRIVEPGREGRHDDPDRELHLRCHPTPHTDVSVAWRLETPAGTMGYTGDTGPSDALGGFLGGCDLLVAECAVSDEVHMETHLSPSSVASLARRADPGLLLLTHPYPSVDPVRLPDLLRKAGYDGWAVTAWDGTAVELEDGRIRLLREGSG